MRSRTLRRRETLLYLLPAAFFTVLAALSSLLASGQRENNILLARMEMQRRLFALRELNRERINDEQSFPEGVLGGAVYDAQGLPLERFGTAPVRIDPALLGEHHESFRLNERSGTISVLQRLPFADRPRPRPRGGEPPPEPPVWAPPAVYIFLETEGGEFFGRQARLRTTSLGLIVGLLAMLVLSEFMLARGLRYRRILREQEDLVRLGEAARTLSHEIKNPLSAIRLRADILARFVGPEGDEDLDMIRSEVDRLRALTDRIGEFLRNPLGTPEKTDLVESVRRIVARCGRPVPVEIAGGEPLLVTIDPLRLESVIANLLQNALESGTADVLVRVEACGREASLSILDRGVGIDKSAGARAFEPFFTTKITGTGMGLAIARRFVEAAGGTIRLQPRAGGGTEARVSLKRVEP